MPAAGWVAMSKCHGSAPSEEASELDIPVLGPLHGPLRERHGEFDRQETQDRET